MAASPQPSQPLGGTAPRRLSASERALAERRAQVAAEQRQRLTSIALVVPRQREDAEDIASEAISRAMASDVDPDVLPAWLTTTTKRLVVDEVRRRDRRRSLVSRLGALHSDEDEDVIDLRLDRAEADWLSTVVRTLPARQRQALELLVESSDIAAVAETMGVSYKAAEHLLARARSAVRSSAKATWAVLVLWSGSRLAKRMIAVPAAGVALTASIALLVHDQPVRTPNASPPAALAPGDDDLAPVSGLPSTGAPSGADELPSLATRIFANPYRVSDASNEAHRPVFTQTNHTDFFGTGALGTTTYDRTDTSNDPVLMLWQECVQGLRFDPRQTGYIGCGVQPYPADGHGPDPLLGDHVPDIPLYPEDGIIYPEHP